MTNQEAKLQVIKKAYGQYWEEIQNKRISDDGCVLLMNDDPLIKTANLYCKHVYNRLQAWYCPLSINNIEYNNGWIRIEKDSDLPDKTMKCRVSVEGLGKMDACFDLEENLFYINLSDRRSVELDTPLNSRVYLANNKPTHWKEFIPELDIMF